MTLRIIKNNMAKKSKIVSASSGLIKTKAADPIEKKGSSFFTRNPGYWNSRLLIGSPQTGLVRSEWVMARYGQTIPTNWSNAEVTQWMSSYMPLCYQLADAENLIAKTLVEGDWEWLLFIESDNVLPQNTLIKLNEYMIKGDVPVVGGLYFTKSVPPEPMIYRELGKGYYADWKMGDKVWCAGLPFGCTLIHASLVKELWKNAPEYVVNGVVTRRVFKHPDSNNGPDPEGFAVIAGTTDLNFFKEIQEKNIFETAANGRWKKYAKKKYPFLVDTRIFVKHIDMDGVQWPLSLPEDFINGKKPLRDFLTL